MSDDPRPRHVHDDSCWEAIDICPARDVPAHVCDQTCVEVQKKCEYRGLY